MDKKSSSRKRAARVLGVASASAAVLASGAAREASLPKVLKAPETAARAVHNAALRADGFVDEKVRLVLSAPQKALLAALLNTSSPKVIAGIVTRSLNAEESGRPLATNPPVWN